jgi:hypothetical protein
MLTFAILWGLGSVVAFLSLRHFALRDFGCVTVGGLIGLLLASALAPFGLLLALFLSMVGGGGFTGKTVWTRDRQ